MKKTVLIVFVFAAMVLAGCGDGSANSDELRRLAGTNMPQQAARQVAQPPTPRPTETPDLSDAQPALQPAAAPQIVEVTRIVPATVEVPVTERIVVTATPQPPTCNTMAVVLPLDATDVAAGVVMRGAMSPCAHATAQAAGVLP